MTVADTDTGSVVLSLVRDPEDLAAWCREVRAFLMPDYIVPMAGMTFPPWRPLPVTRAAVALPLREGLMGYPEVTRAVLASRLGR
jgi:hypothetical protein